MLKKHKQKININIKLYNLKEVTQRQFYFMVKKYLKDNHTKL